MGLRYRDTSGDLRWVPEHVVTRPLPLINQVPFLSTATSPVRSTSSCRMGDLTCILNRVEGATLLSVVNISNKFSQVGLLEFRVPDVTDCSEHRKGE